MIEDLPPHRLRLLIPAARLEARVSELAAAIGADHPEPSELVVIGVLKGSVVFFSDLMRKISGTFVVDFLQTSSYGSGRTAGEVRIKRDIEVPVRGRDVLLVEDIVDTGWTVRTLLDLFRFRGARRVRLCTLLDKHEAREVEVPIDYCGFQIGREFVVGYGLDFAERYRNLPDICAVEFLEESKEGKEK
jgi:hypoxanthine phosphoribosyltransferase